MNRYQCSECGADFEIKVLGFGGEPTVESYCPYCGHDDLEVIDDE